MGKTQNMGELITPPDTLRRKAGGSFGPANKDAIARAEAAMDGLSSRFDDWIGQEVTKLEAARKDVRDKGLSSDAGQALFNAAHDLKGLGATYGYPFVSAIADTLCKITLDADIRTKAPMELVNAHVDSIRAVVRGQIKTTDHPVGKKLVAELSGRVETFLATT